MIQCRGELKLGEMGCNPTYFSKPGSVVVDKETATSMTAAVLEQIYQKKRSAIE